MSARLITQGNLCVGDVIHKLTLLENVGVGSYNDELWLCKCECGSIVTISSLQLLNGLKTCKNCARPYRDLTDKIFGKLTAILYCGKGRWICKCECGRLVRASSCSLCNGKATRCVSCALVIDLTGKMFGYWKVLSRAEYICGHIAWDCVCTKCGTRRKVIGSNLKRTHTLSCGCCNAEVARKCHTTHGMTKTRFYNIWGRMHYRCNNPKCKTYKHYGGRGIKICEEWNDSFEAFRDDMYEAYLKHAAEYGEKNTTLDRIDVNGNYCPKNCRWATWKEQGEHKRNSEFITFGNVSHTFTDWCQILGLGKASLLKWKKKFNLTGEEVLIKAIARFNVDMGEYYD